MEVSKHMPNDIALSILSKLSLKSLKRFECVNKSWSLLFDNPYFMTMFGNNLLTKDHPYYEDTYVLIQTTPNDCASIYNDYFFLHSFSGERCENVVKLDWPKPFQDDDPPNQENHTCFTILGSVSINGILCLQYNHYDEIQIVLWNPTTKEFKFIPSSPIESKRHWRASPHNNRVRVGYDRVTHDYKMLRFISCLRNDLLHTLDTFWEMYSRNSNTWRTIDVNMPNSYDDVDVYMDGVCHWWSKRDAHTCLVSFDFSNESFITTLIPSHWGLVVRHLMLLNGSIAFILQNIETSTFHISILGELGVKDSWTKVFVVGLLPCLHYPIGAGKKGNILFRKKDGELVWFDLCNKMIVEIGVATRFCYLKTILHRESILPIGVLNN